jgi:cell wall-associated NlpC family hydrolase
VNTLGWLFILAGILIARQVSRGRVMNIAEDLGDAFIAVASGDSQELGVILTRTGESATPTPEGIGGTTAVSEGMGSATGLAAAAIARGQKAKGYRWAATGPDYYDCSGLIWRACQDMGFKGSRFSTADMAMRKGFTRISPPGVSTPGVTTATADDLVLWPAGSGGVTGHVGVITSPNKFYSARSVRSGIGEASISGFRRTSPQYYRFKAS